MKNVQRMMAGDGGEEAIEGFGGSHPYFRAVAEFSRVFPEIARFLIVAGQGIYFICQFLVALLRFFCGERAFPDCFPVFTGVGVGFERLFHQFIQADDVPDVR